MFTLHRSVMVFFTCAGLFLAARAHAQANSDDASRAVARQLGAEGIDAYQENDLGVAEQKLERAYRLFPAPTLGLWSARTLAKLGRWVEAAERYREAPRMSPQVGDSEAQRTAQREAAQELEALLPRIPTLTVALEGQAADVTVLLDDSPLPKDLLGVARPTNPGAHKLIAERSGERLEETFTLVEKEHRTIPLAFKQSSAQPTAATEAPETKLLEPERVAATMEPMPAPAADIARNDTTAAPAGSPWLTVGVTSLALGGAGLVTWGVGALIADKKLGRCPVGDDGDHYCMTEELARPYRTAKTISTIGFWAGAALTASGLGALYLHATEREPAPQGLSFGVGAGSLAVSGKF